MDTYLESLVAKDATSAEDDAAQTIEETNDEVIASSEENAEEAVENIADDPADEVIDASAVEEVAPAEAKSDEEPLFAQPMKFVKEVKVYNIPDKNSVYNVFTGNIIFKSVVNDMILIEYVKPGAGLVKGFIEAVE